MNRQNGFTLIELMIVVVIIGILAAIAIPNYQKYVLRTLCEDGKATLLSMASALERYRAQHNSYRNASLDNLGFSDSTLQKKNDNFVFSMFHNQTVGFMSTGECANVGSAGDNSYTKYSLEAIGKNRLMGKVHFFLDSQGTRCARHHTKAWESCSGI